MKKTFIKTICTLLVMTMTFSLLAPVSVCANAEDTETCSCGFAPTVFVNGINTKEVSKNLGTDNVETIFPPSGEKIKSQILNKTTLGGIAKFLITHDWDTLGDVLIPAAKEIFSDCACLPDGTVKPGTGIDWDYRTAPLSDDKSHRSESYTTFYYDWRLDPIEIAHQLNDYIERVCEHTGHDKVNLVGFSMGSVIVMAYISAYKYDRIAGIVMSAPAFNGVATCGEPFAGKIVVEPLAVARFMDDMLGDDAKSVCIKSLINLLYKTGALNIVATFANKLVENLLERVYDEVMTDSLATMSGLWSLVSEENYETAKASMFKDTEKYSEFIAKIDNYHYNVQKKGDELIAGALERGIKFGVVAKYGSQLTPCIEGWDKMGDSVIDTKGESFGAECATLEGTLGDSYTQKVQCGHNHISADRQIDASAGKYPEMTWYVRGLLHSSSCRDYDDLVEYILYSDTQVTVNDSDRWTQFQLYDSENNILLPLTSQNAALEQSIAGYSLSRVTKDFFSSLIGLMK